MDDLQHAPMGDFDMTKCRILCVDDEPHILSSLRRMFLLEGMTVAVAPSGAQALRMLAEQEFHLVLSDMLMPEMNGAELLAFVRTQYPRIKRFMLTGTIELTAAMAAVNQGVVHQCLTKPWVNDEVIAAVRAALAHPA